MVPSIWVLCPDGNLTRRAALIPVYRDELRVLLELVAAARADGLPSACGQALSPAEMLRITLAMLLAQAKGDIELALDDALGGQDDLSAYPYPLVERDGAETAIGALTAGERLTTMFGLWAQAKVSFPLLCAVLADRGVHWPQLMQAFCRAASVAAAGRAPANQGA